MDKHVKVLSELRRRIGWQAPDVAAALDYALDAIKERDTFTAWLEKESQEARHE